MPLRIGIDLGGTKIEGVVLDDRSPIARTRIDTPRDYRQTLDAIVQLVHDLESWVPDRGIGTPTIGIGIPGVISPRTDRVKNANSTWLIGRLLSQDLESRLYRPVRVANDANCFAISEATDGAAAGAGVVFGVIIGTGTGGGIVVDGRLLTGANAIAGEWGHNPLPWQVEEEMAVPPCYCGKRGCIESFLSGPGMTADHERRTGTRLMPPEIERRANAGETDAEATLIRYEHRMARALASVINVLDPDVIVLGGGMSNIERLYSNVPRLWTPYVFDCGNVELGTSGAPDTRPETRLVRALHGDSSGVRGAAWLWPDSTLTDR